MSKANCILFSFVRAMFLLLLVLVDQQNLKAQLYSLETDSIAQQIKIRMDRMAFDICLLHPKLNLSVYNDPNGANPISLLCVSDSLNKKQGLIDLNDVQPMFKGLKYTIFSYKKGRHAAFIPKALRINISSNAFWVILDELKAFMSPEDFSFLMLVLQNREGFEGYAVNEMYDSRDTMEYFDSSAFVMDYRFKVNLEVYFINEIKAAIQAYTNHQFSYFDWIGFYYDSAFKKPMLNADDLFGNKGEKTHQMVIVQDNYLFSDFLIMRINTESRYVELSLVDPLARANNTISQSDIVQVFCPLNELWKHFSKFADLWISGLYAL